MTGVFGSQKPEAVSQGDEDASLTGESDTSSSEDEFSEKQPRGKRNEDPEAKKERKLATKEAARERRKHKIPKAVKKRKEKVAARGNHKTK